MNLRRIIPAAALAAFSLSIAPHHAAADTTYTIRQTFTVGELPKGAKQVRGWFWMPEDRPGQQVLDFRIVEGPKTVKITRDPSYGRSWIYAEAPASKDKPLKVVTEFKILRQTVNSGASADKTGPLTDEHRRQFAAELRKDEKHMEVSAEIQKLADEMAGTETNPVTQAKKFFDFVIEKSEHYSKAGPDPKGLCLGDAKECMAGTGDCCTDQHALFIALCRARGIPCRLMFGSRLKLEKEGQDYDPGYRCWPVFFAPNLGWVPVDVSSGDASKEKADADKWFGGMDDKRVEWAEGRDFELSPKSKVKPDLVIRGWVEVDGKQSKNLTRTLNFKRDGAAAAAANPVPAPVAANPATAPASIAPVK
jgi:transglutaminase-like putative cysteine protease